ncbi:hypothetical protein, partial [Marinoscillum pacificum]|uniref:hypothetical protein n=1 Tax=Marinoscillum pacificum TaxID=392723 RepID=UPI002157F245
EIFLNHLVTFCHRNLISMPNWCILLFIHFDLHRLCKPISGQDNRNWPLASQRRTASQPPDPFQAETTSSRLYNKKAS